MQSLHAICTGRKKDNSKFCPVSYLPRGVSPSVVLRELLPGHSRAALNVLPNSSQTTQHGCDKPSISSHVLNKPSITDVSEVHDVSENDQPAERIAEYEVGLIFHFCCDVYGFMFL